MTYSCSDFTDEILNRLVALNLINPHDVAANDPEQQAKLAVSAITSISQSVAILAGLLDTVISAIPQTPQLSLPVATLALGQVDPVLREKVRSALGADMVMKAVHGPAARFLEEVLNMYDCLTDVVDIFNSRTLADVLYLHSALHKQNMIEVFLPTESRILELIRTLPSAGYWMTHIDVRSH